MIICTWNTAKVSWGETLTFLGCSMNIGKSEIKIINIITHYIVNSSLAELAGVSVNKLPTVSFPFITLALKTILQM